MKSEFVPMLPPPNRRRLFAAATASALPCRLLMAALLWLGLLLWTTEPAAAQGIRVKEIASVQGVRSNQLTGYGLVVGLDGTGDQTTQMPYTAQSLQNQLQQLGLSLPPGASLQLKNVAAVMVTGQLPAFAQPGQMMDVTVSSIGNAKSLRGGTLITTPLKGADGQIYALAQGNLLVGGAGASAGGSKVQINHLSAGRIPGGAQIERAVATPFALGDTIDLGLDASDFGRVIRLRAPADPNARVGFLAAVEEVRLEAPVPVAKVIINSRTGSIVMNQAVTLAACAVSHGNLSVSISSTPVISQPNPLSPGAQTVVTEKANIQISQDSGSLIEVPAAAKLSDVVRALNALGATPQDLLAILQAIKASGALNAELEVI
jgi:flagellar P-ring protein FlgI